MANDGILGGFFDQRVHLRDAHYAADAFGFNKADLSNGTPRHKFEFFLRINFNPDADVTAFARNFLDIVDQSIITTMVKTVTMPSMTVDTDVLNQYNKKRISQSRINFRPVTITMHDSVEGRTLRFWEMYYEYYFRDGLAHEKLDLNNQGRTRNSREFQNDVILNRFNDNFGYNIERVGNNKYLIDSIEIFQIHGGNFSRVELVRPRITQFTHDTLNYEDSAGLVEMSFEFAYEDVLYDNVNLPMNSEELQRFQNGDYWEMANLVTLRLPVRGRNLNATTGLPNVDVCGPGSTLDLASKGTSKILSSRVGSAIFKAVGQQNVQRVEDTVSGIVGSIPNAVSSAVTSSIFGGSVSFTPNPEQVLKSTASQVTRNVVNRNRDRFSSAISSGVNNVISGVSNNQGG